MRKSIVTEQEQIAAIDALAEELLFRWKRSTFSEYSTEAKECLRTRILKQLLFSNGKIRLRSKDNKSVIEICESDEEYTPTFNWNNIPGPFLRTMYSISISCAHQEPHRTFSFHEIEECEQFLKSWSIETEDGWCIVEKEAN